jgi:hypothetical protein
MSDVTIYKKNEVYIKLECEPHILYELSPYFTFSVESAKFMPQYRGRGWNGEIRLLSTATGEIYAGLLDKVIAKIKNHGYTYEFKDNKYYNLPFEVNEEITEEGVKGYMKHICTLNPYDYQVNAVYECLRYNRKTIVSATSSGKSYMIYALVRYYVTKKKRVLVVFPTTSLIQQMYKDWIEYGWDAEKYCHMIYSGQEKNPLWVYVTTEGGIRYKFNGNQTINLINNKKKLAKDLKETDEIDDRWLLSIKE